MLNLHSIHINTDTWATHIKQVLFQFGFGYAWLANEVGDTIAFTKLFKIRVVDCAIQNLNVGK